MCKQINAGAWIYLGRGHDRCESSQVQVHARGQGVLLLLLWLVLHASGRRRDMRILNGKAHDHVVRGRELDRWHHVQQQGHLV